MPKILAVANHKGGTGKTATTISLGAALSQRGKRILLIDGDAQANLTTSLSLSEFDGSLYDVLEAAINNSTLAKNVIVSHEEGMDIIPARLDLASMDMTLNSVMNRERMLHYGLEQFLKQYDYIIIDSPPSLGMLTINALAAANSVIIPVQAEYLPATGMTQIIHTIQLIRRGINPNLQIAGVLMTMTDNRTRISRDTIELVRSAYGKSICVFKTEIPRSVKVPESSASGKSILVYEPNGKVAQAYKDFSREVMNLGWQKNRDEPHATR